MSPKSTRGMSLSSGSSGCVRSAPMRDPDRDIIEQLLARADDSGKSLNTYMARLNYGEVEVERLLKGRSPYISIQRGDFPEKFGVPAVLLFPAA